MASIFNLAERQFAPPTVIAKQRDELLNLNGRYSDGTGPGDQPAAAASAAPIRSGQPLNNAPGAPTDLAPKLREQPPTIATTNYYKSDTSFLPQGSPVTPDMGGATIGGGNRSGDGWQQGWLISADKDKARQQLINDISQNYMDNLQNEVSSMDPDQANERIRREKLFGPSIGADKDWTSVQPYYKHKAWEALPSYWPYYKKEAAIRQLQGIEEEDRIFPYEGAGAFDKATGKYKSDKGG